MEGALRQEEERWQQRIETETRKREEAKKCMRKQRDDALKAKEEQRARKVAEGKAELQHNINLDEAAHREDEERRTKRLQQGRELAQLYLGEMVSGMHTTTQYFGGVGEFWTLWEVNTAST